MSLTIGERSKKLNGNGAWANYAVNKRERQNYTLRIDCEGNAYYMGKAGLFTEQEFNQFLPIGLIDRSAHIRLDSRQRIY